MKTKAAILRETGKPLEIHEIEIPALRPGQVLVRIAYSGVCHTQLLEVEGKRGPDKYLPHCLGHEGSGTIVKVGESVSKVKVGDKVILSWIKGSGADITGTQYHLDGEVVNAGGITTFSEYAVISENHVTKITTENLADAAMVGCAVATGLGAVRNTAEAVGGESAAIFGCGGIGSCAVAGARIAGCDPIVAIDLNEQKLALAQKMGATHIIAASGDTLEQLRSLVPNLHLAVEATGNTKVMQEALMAVRPRGGRAVIIGNAPHGSIVEVNPGELNQGKRLLGTWGGDNDPDKDFPYYLRLLETGELDLSPLTAKQYKLEEINTALADLREGRVYRPLIKMTP